MIKKARKIIKKVPQLDRMAYLINNAGRIISDSVNMRSKHPRIKNIMVEPTNACNLNCFMCNAKDSTRKKGFMSMDVFNRILKEAALLSVSNLVMHTVGESLSHPKIIDMIKMAKKAGFSVRLSSNGMLLNPDFSRDIVKSGLDQFRFSIEGATKKTYESIRQGADFGTLLDNVTTFKKLRDKRGKAPNITIGSIVMKETEPELETFYKLFSPLVDSIEFTRLGNQGGQVDKAFSASSVDSAAFTGARYPCKLLWSTTVILWNGDVSCCCIDFDGKLIVGNIMNESLKNIWTSDGYEKFRMLHKTKRQNEMNMCGSCSVTFKPGSGYSQYKMNRQLRRDYGVKT